MGNPYLILALGWMLSLPLFPLTGTVEVNSTYFAYIVIGNLKMSPQQIYEEYRKRFGIESTYRLMNTMWARTTSRSVALRLFFVDLALLLLNLWAYVKWRFSYKRQAGPRQVLHYLLPLARWRLWLWEMVKQPLGFSLEIALADL